MQNQSQSSKNFSKTFSSQIIKQTQILQDSIRKTKQRLSQSKQKFDKFQSVVRNIPNIEACSKKFQTFGKSKQQTIQNNSNIQQNKQITELDIQKNSKSSRSNIGTFNNLKNHQEHQIKINQQSYKKKLNQASSILINNYSNAQFQQNLCYLPITSQHPALSQYSEIDKLLLGTSYQHTYSQVNNNKQILQLVKNLSIVNKLSDEVQRYKNSENNNGKIVKVSNGNKQNKNNEILRLEREIVQRDNNMRKVCNEYNLLLKEYLREKQENKQKDDGFNKKINSLRKQLDLAKELLRKNIKNDEYVDDKNSKQQQLMQQNLELLKNNKEIKLQNYRLKQQLRMIKKQNKKLVKQQIVSDRKLLKNQQNLQLILQSAAKIGYSHPKKLLSSSKHKKYSKNIHYQQQNKINLHNKY